MSHAKVVSNAVQSSADKLRVSLFGNILSQILWVSRFSKRFWWRFSFSDK